MKCPFELPLEKKVKKYDDEPDGLIIVQADGLPILTAGKDRGLCGKRNLSRQLDYIVQTINIYEKYEKALDWIKGATDVEEDRCKCGRPTGVLAIHNHAKQALKEAEKPK